jgi:DcaP outer membrane protein
MSVPKSFQNIASTARTAVGIGLLATPLVSFAQAPEGDAATIALLREQVAALTRRLDEMERRQAAQAPVKPEKSVEADGKSVQAEVREARAAAKEARVAAAEFKAAQRKIEAASAAAPGAPATDPVISTGTIQGLLPPEEMGSAATGEDALRSDLSGIALRIPNTNTEARLYGFAKLTAYQDFDGRNQTDVPTVQTIPLNGSPADVQGGDFGMSARFSRFGTDTRTLTDHGTLETRLEGDFGGGTSANATFRLRQAWGELGNDKYSILIGQANSLWNEGVFETLIDSTNLNQSFVRQAQIRLTRNFSSSMIGQFSVEAPDTTYTSVNNVVNPNSVIDGGASPAFNTMPDFLGRLTYRKDGLEVMGRALLRDLTVDTNGTAVAPFGKDEALGWGIAGLVRFPMRWISDGLGPDQFTVMAYGGDGIGRYFVGNTSGQDALSNLGLAAATDSFSLDAVQSWGLTAAYRRFWSPTLRSNFAYSYARQDYPGYASSFTPGSSSATSLNSDMNQVFVNLFWSPFGTINDGVFSSGWLDLGIEYLYSYRDLLGGSSAAGSGDGEGTANRVLIGGVARF